MTSQSSASETRTRRRRVRVDALRAAAADKVERTSLRHVAREIGMSAPGLRLFLDGAYPRTDTLRKIRDWYFGEASARADDLSVETARAAVRLLVEGLPERERALVTRKVVERLMAAYRRQGTSLPGWLDVLRMESCADDGE